MGLIVSAPKGGSYTPPPAGNHLARCYRVIDLGTQKSEWNGQPKALKKLQIFWELHGDDAEGNPMVMEDGRPLVASRKFTASLGNKAKLYEFLVSWRGKDFTRDEFDGFSLKNILDKWCMINITHTQKNDRIYANITGVSAVPSAIKKAGLPEGINTCIFFDIDEPDMRVFETFSDYLKEQIMGSPEWQMKHGDSSYSEPQSKSDEEDDDIPF
jgi:hypothetical protein